MGATGRKHLHPEQGRDERGDGNAIIGATWVLIGIVAALIGFGAGSWISGALLGAMAGVGR